MSSIATNMKEAISRIEVMRYQEETNYVVSDYLYQNDSNGPSLCSGPLHRSSLDDDSIMYDIDADCRAKMAIWCYQVIDFCKFNRETAEISMSYLDRYLLTPEGSVALFDRSLFQLASMTALYTAVKIHEPEAMDPKLVAKLSRGLYTPEEIEEMEREMLTALDWRVNPPTSLSFVREFLKIIPEETLNEKMRETACDVTRLQTELAVREYNFIGVKPSTIAFCSFMNALESLIIDEQLLGYVGCIVAEASGIDCNSDEIVQVQGCLYDSVIGRQQITNVEVSPKPEPRRGVARIVSPRSITGFY